jgi:hypothetical protein
LDTEKYVVGLFQTKDDVHDFWGANENNPIYSMLVLVARDYLALQPVSMGAEMVFVDGRGRMRY